jgi:CRP-like cAMP-binding protein
MDARTALRGSPLLAELDDDQIGSLERIATRRSVAAGTLLTVEGAEKARAMYIILVGAFEVRREGKQIAELGPGEHFGEMALLVPDLPRSADVVATTDTEVLQLTSWDFLPILKSNPEVAMSVIEQLARRLIEADHKLANV